MDLTVALSRLFASDEGFEEVLRALERDKRRALAALADLLKHPDPGWRRVAATALGRMRQTPRGARPDLLEMLNGPDAGASVAALSAIEWLPPEARDEAVPDMIRLLASARPAGPSFTHGRAHVPRGAAAHFLGMHGGARGLAALQRFARRRTDPMIYQIDAALERATEVATMPKRPSRPKR
jgi:HEAT repeat protein